VICYFNRNYLTGILTQDDIVAENNERLFAILNNALAKWKKISFIAINFEGLLEKIDKKNYYILYLYGSLING